MHSNLIFFTMGLLIANIGWPQTVEDGWFKIRGPISSSHHTLPPPHLKTGRQALTYSPPHPLPLPRPSAAPYSASDDTIAFIHTDINTERQSGVWKNSPTRHCVIVSAGLYTIHCDVSQEPNFVWPAACVCRLYYWRLAPVLVFAEAGIVGVGVCVCVCRCVCACVSVVCACVC